MLSSSLRCNACGSGVLPFRALCKTWKVNVCCPTSPCVPPLPVPPSPASCQVGFEVQRRRQHRAIGIWGRARKKWVMNSLLHSYAASAFSTLQNAQRSSCTNSGFDKFIFPFCPRTLYGRSRLPCVYLLFKQIWWITFL